MIAFNVSFGNTMPIFRFMIVFVTTSAFSLGAQYITDPDGNKYTTVQIGNQEWIVENWRSATYSDGSAIPHIQTRRKWKKTDSFGYCCYDNNESNQFAYGILYKLSVITSSKPFLPGWRIPNVEDWRKLEKTIADTRSSFIEQRWEHSVATALAAQSMWKGLQNRIPSQLSSIYLTSLHTVNSVHEGCKIKMLMWQAVDKETGKIIRESYSIEDLNRYETIKKAYRKIKVASADLQVEHKLKKGVPGYRGASNNSSGFSAVPAGYRSHNGTFKDRGIAGYWWAGPSDEAKQVDIVRMQFDKNTLEQRIADINAGYSIRLMRDID